VNGKDEQLNWACAIKLFTAVIEESALKNVNNRLNTDIYTYLRTSGGQSFNLYLNVVHCFNTSLN